MPYQMHRVFCATPTGLEPERDAFYEVVGVVNETTAMPQNLLLVAVSLPPMPDKRPYQKAVDDNVRACRYYIQVLGDGWGPPGRNFECDYALARECAADPRMPMQEAVLLRKGPGESAETFRTLDEFKQIVRALLMRWMETLNPCGSPTAP